MTNYWCYRIDTSQIEFFLDELNLGRLRQGWGWDEKQNLENLQVDDGAGRNMKMFEEVKQGDILLVPQLPEWGKVAIVKATADWKIGYKFEIDSKLGDYGHIFPAEYMRSFIRSSSLTTGNLRSTLKNPSRFWNINHYSEDVEQLLSAPQEDLEKYQDFESRMRSVVENAFNSNFEQQKFKNQLFEQMNKQFTREEWEYALVVGLKELFPFYEISRQGGVSEKDHGTDILIKLPSLPELDQYAIAIQVKDYDGMVEKQVIDQINRADEYWNKKGVKLIDKWIIVTKATKDQNAELSNVDDSVEIIFAGEVEELLSQMGKKMVELVSCP